MGDADDTSMAEFMDKFMDSLIATIGQNDRDVEHIFAQIKELKPHGDKLMDDFFANPFYAMAYVNDILGANTTLCEKFEQRNKATVDCLKKWKNNLRVHNARVNQRVSHRSGNADESHVVKRRKSEQYQYLHSLYNY